MTLRELLSRRGTTMSVETAKPGEKPRLERWLEALLDPKTIHYLLGLGGGLCVLGVVVWLASLGVFKDALTLGVSLIAGNSVVLAAGLLLAIRTGYRTAGNAVAFLACVLAPLNLWFLHAQNLITVADHLWIGGVVCSLVFAAVVKLLREPMHVYAVQIGATLSVLLLLADVNRALDPVYLAVAGVALAAVSLQCIRAFPIGDGTFSRDRFFLPLFLSGQVQLAAGLIVLAASQLFGGWPILGRYGLEWLSGGFDRAPWLAALVWGAGAFLYLTSHRFVPAGRVFATTAIVCIIFAVMSIVNPYLGVDGRIVAYAACSLVFAVRSFADANKPLRELAVAGSLTLGMLACAAVGMRVNHLFWYAGMATGWPLFAAALFAAATQLVASRYVQDRSRTATWVQAMLAGATLSTVVVVGQSLLRPEANSYAVLGTLIAIPATIMALVNLRLPEAWKRTLAIASMTAVAIAALTGLGAPQAFGAILHPSAENPATLHLALIAAQLAVVSGSALTVRRHPSLIAACGTGVVTTLWLALGVLGVPAAYFATAAAAIGLVCVIVGQSVGSGWSVRPALVGVGRTLVVIAALATAFQTIPIAFDAGRWIDVSGFALVALVCAAAGMMDADKDWRRAFRTFAIICGIGTLFDVNALVDLPTWRKTEFIACFFGLAVVAAGYAERFLNGDERETVGGFMWFGALLAAVPVLAAAMYFRFDQGYPSLPEEFATLTVGIVLSASGLGWRFKAPTIVGLGTLAVYLAVLIGQLAYHPQVAVGVYLAVGGGVLFAAAALLAAYRESILALPDAIERRQGIFKVLDWR
jgi:hypothetical protein